MHFSEFDYQCMAESLRLAAKGMDTTHPNPRVGCVLAKDDQVVGTGWHRSAGEPHAEVMALRDAGEQAKGATAYVNLEPCAHHGRTPPCSSALTEAGIKRVVAAVGDPFPQVDGNGFSALKAAGIQVESGLMASRAEQINAGFLKRVRQGLPWVRVKLAHSLDGRTALQNGQSKWISCEAARLDVQRWRARSSCIMTGIGTMLADDPSLNVRVDNVMRQPLRVIADGYWRTPPSARTLGLPGEVLIAGRRGIELSAALNECGAECVALPSKQGKLDLHALLSLLAERGVNEVQVEAGATLCGALLKAGLVDEVMLYVAPVVLGVGGRGAFDLGPLEDMAQRIEFEWLDSRRVGSSLRLQLAPKYGVA
jgi:diaminohydroxyphosphoribosylaminopyrimidine deaminase/5-amino-6-(5-phosphoribosylamino)uracil reductase